MTDKKTVPDEAKADKKSGGGLIGMIILAVSAIAASFGASFLLTPGAEPVAEAALACDPQAPAPVKKAKRKDKTFVALEEILITVGSEPATRYLKMEVSIVTDDEHAYLVEEDAPILMDAFINYLRSVELSDFEDPAFYSQMREQLSRRSELVLGASATDGILVTSFLLR